MSKKSRTRFFARIDGNGHQLLSVMERNDGSLIVFSAIPKNWENTNRTLTAFREQHYSIHRTKGGVDTTFTQKTRLSDGRTVSNVAYIHGTTEHLLWPVFARRVPTLRPTTHLLTLRQNDRVIQVGTYRYDTANLLYSVFVAKQTCDIDRVKVEGATIQIADFSEFKIIVLATYLNIPSPDQGDVVGIATSPTVNDGVFAEGHFQLDVTSIPADDILECHWLLMCELRDWLLLRLRELLGGTSAPFHDAVQMVAVFTSAPLRP